MMSGQLVSTRLNEMTATMSFTKPAEQAIKNLYSIEQLKEIAMHGCISGVAPDFIYTTDCCNFYYDNQKEIDEWLELYHNVESVMELVSGTSSIQEAVNRLCWIYVDGIAQELVLQSEYEAD